MFSSITNALQRSVVVRPTPPDGQNIIRGEVFKVFSLILIFLAKYFTKGSC